MVACRNFDVESKFFVTPINILEEQRRSVENAKRFKEVERQQEEFGEDRK